MKNREIELISQECIEPFDKTKIYFVITNYGNGTNVTDEYYFWIDGQKRIHAKSKAGKKVDESARLVSEDYECERKHAESITAIGPSYDQWGHMGMIAGNNFDFRAKMFEQFTTSPQGVQIKTLINKKLAKEQCKSPNNEKEKIVQNNDRLFTKTWQKRTFRKQPIYELIKTGKSEKVEMTTSTITIPKGYDLFSTELLIKMELKNFNTIQNINNYEFTLNIDQILRSVEVKASVDKKGFPKRISQDAEVIMITVIKVRSESKRIFL